MDGLMVVSIEDKKVNVSTVVWTSNVQCRLINATVGTTKYSQRGRPKQTRIEDVTKDVAFVNVL